MKDEPAGGGMTLLQEVYLDMRAAEAAERIARTIHTMVQLCQNEGVSEAAIRARVEELMGRRVEHRIEHAPGFPFPPKPDDMFALLRQVDKRMPAKTPDPQPVIVGVDLASGPDETVELEVVPEPETALEPEPEPDPKPEPAATYKTGPWSEDEEATALELDARGASLGEIAQELGRNPRSMNVKMIHLRKRIEADDPPEEDPRDPEPESAVVDQIEAALEEGATTPAGENPTPPSTARPVGRAGFTFKAPVSSAMKVHHAHERLNSLGYRDGWTPVRDAILARTLAAGDGVVAASIRLALGHGLPTKEDMVARWSELCPEKTIAAQAVLIPALEARSKAWIEAGEPNPKGD